MPYKTPKILTIAVGCQGTSLNDSTTYYFGVPFYNQVTNTACQRKVYMAYSGFIRRVELWLYNNAIPTAENTAHYIRLNDTTDTLITNQSLAAQQVRIYNDALNIAVAKGDYIEIKFITPAWVTNVNSYSVAGTLYIEIP